MLATPEEAENPHSVSRKPVPWQLWVVIVLLSLEGVGNLVDIPALPMPAFWLVMKILFVCGFLCRSRVVYLLFCLIALVHVLAFAIPAPFAAFLNLVMMILVMTQYRHFFPAAPRAAMP